MGVWEFGFVWSKKSALAARQVAFLKRERGFWWFACFFGGFVWAKRKLRAHHIEVSEAIGRGLGPAGV
jgi:hypothetical protein